MHRNKTHGWTSISFFTLSIRHSQRKIERKLELGDALWIHFYVLQLSISILATLKWKGTAECLPLQKMHLLKYVSAWGWVPCDLLFLAEPKFTVAWHNKKTDWKTDLFSSPSNWIIADGISSTSHRGKVETHWGTSAWGFNISDKCSDDMYGYAVWAITIDPELPFFGEKHNSFQSMSKGFWRAVLSRSHLGSYIGRGNWSSRSFLKWKNETGKSLLNIDHHWSK